MPDARELRRDPAERDDPIGDDAQEPGRGARPPLSRPRADQARRGLRGLLPLLLPPRAGRAGRRAGSSAEAFAAALDYMRARPAIWEVILTGGDPLTLSPRRIAEATRAIAAIDARQDAALAHPRCRSRRPERVTPAMARALDAGDKTVVVAVHANHPRELTAEARAACRRLAERGILLVSQTVLLKGVNDDVEVLDALMRAFVEARIKPYYLHHGDLAPGTAHWRTSIAEGQALMRALARPPVGPRHADLRARHPRRPRQGPGRAGVDLAGRRRRLDRRSTRRRRAALPRPPRRMTANGRVTTARAGPRRSPRASASAVPGASTA